MTLWNPWGNVARIVTVASSGSHDSSSAHRMFHFSQLSHVQTSIKLNALHSMLTLWHSLWIGYLPRCVRHHIWGALNGFNVIAWYLWAPGAGPRQKGENHAEAWPPASTRRTQGRYPFHTMRRWPTQDRWIHSPGDKETVTIHFPRRSTHRVTWETVRTRRPFISPKMITPQGTWNTETNSHHTR